MTPLTGFRHGWFFIVYVFAAYAIRLWPNAQVWVADGRGGWQRSTLRERHLFWKKYMTAPVTHPLNILRQSNGCWAEYDGQLVFPEFHLRWIREHWNQLHHEQLLGTLPEPIRKVFSQFVGPDGFWVLKFIQGSRAAQDLFMANPGLGYLLATARRYQKALPLPIAVSLASKPQRQIMAALGYPPSEHLRLILMRMKIYELEPQFMGTLRRILARSDVFDLIAQVERLDPVVMLWLGAIHHWPLYTPSLIAELATDKEEQNQWSLDGLDLLVEAAAYGLWKPRPLQSLDHYQNQVKALHRRLRYSSLILPRPPCHGDAEVVPLTTANQLVQEGEEMHHCLGRICDLIAALNGRAHFFKVLAPHRATAALRRNYEDRWELECFRLARNVEPSQEDMNQLMGKFVRWLGETFVDDRPKLTFLDLEESKYSLPQAL
jgi:hypothetical protein